MLTFAEDDNFAACFRWAQRRDNITSKFKEIIFIQDRVLSLAKQTWLLMAYILLVTTGAWNICKHLRSMKIWRLFTWFIILLELLELQSNRRAWNSFSKLKCPWNLSIIRGKNKPLIFGANSAMKGKSWIMRPAPKDTCRVKWAHMQLQTSEYKWKVLQSDRLKPEATKWKTKNA